MFNLRRGYGLATDFNTTHRRKCRPCALELCRQCQFRHLCRVCCLFLNWHFTVTVLYSVRTPISGSKNKSCCTFPVLSPDSTVMSHHASPNPISVAFDGFFIICTSDEALQCVWFSCGMAWNGNRKAVSSASRQLYHFYSFLVRYQSCHPEVRRKLQVSSTSTK